MKPLCQGTASAGSAACRITLCAGPTASAKRPGKWCGELRHLRHLPIIGFYYSPGGLETTAANGRGLAYACMQRITNWNVSKNGATRIGLEKASASMLCTPVWKPTSNMQSCRGLLQRGPFTTLSLPRCTLHIPMSYLILPQVVLTLNLALAVSIRRQQKLTRLISCARQPPAGCAAAQRKRCHRNVGNAAAATPPTQCQQHHVGIGVGVTTGWCAEARVSVSHALSASQRPRHVPRGHRPVERHRHQRNLARCRRLRVPPLGSECNLGHRRGVARAGRDRAPARHVPQPHTAVGAARSQQPSGRVGRDGGDLAGVRLRQRAHKLRAADVEERGGPVLAAEHH
eukprot:365224-Chlamydomonas_euryale.AAC.22